MIEPFDIQYFMFYNMREEKDFKIILNVKSGLADLFVKPFYDDEKGEDGVELDINICVSTVAV